MEHESGAYNSICTIWFCSYFGKDYSIGSCLLVVFAGTMVGIMFSLIAIESDSVWNSGIESSAIALIGYIAVAIIALIMIRKGKVTVSI